MSHIYYMTTGTTEATRTKVSISKKISLKPKTLENIPIEWCIENLSLDNYKQIYHISDIHIRPLQRHD